MKLLMKADIIHIVFYPSTLVTDLIKGVKNNYEEVIDELEEAEFFIKIEKILGTHLLTNSDYDSSDENLFKKKRRVLIIFGNTILCLERNTKKKRIKQ